MNQQRKAKSNWQSSPLFTALTANTSAQAEQPSHKTAVKPRKIYRELCLVKAHREDLAKVIVHSAQHLAKGKTGAIAFVPQDSPGREYLTPGYFSAMEISMNEDGSGLRQAIYGGTHSIEMRLDKAALGRPGFAFYVVANGIEPIRIQFSDRGETRDFKFMIPFGGKLGEKSKNDFFRVVGHAIERYLPFEMRNSEAFRAWLEAQFAVVEAYCTTMFASIAASISSHWEARGWQAGLQVLWIDPQGSKQNYFIGLGRPTFELGMDLNQLERWFRAQFQARNLEQELQVFGLRTSDAVKTAVKLYKTAGESLNAMLEDAYAFIQSQGKAETVIPEKGDTVITTEELAILINEGTQFAYLGNCAERETDHVIRVQAFTPVATEAPERVSVVEVKKSKAKKPNKAEVEG